MTCEVTVVLVSDGRNVPRARVPRSRFNAVRFGLADIGAFTTNAC